MSEIIIALLGVAIPIAAQHIAAALKKQLPWLVLPTVPAKPDSTPLPMPDGKGTLLKAVLVKLARDVLGIEPIKQEEEGELEALQAMIARRCHKKQAEAQAREAAQAVADPVKAPKVIGNDK